MRLYGLIGYPLGHSFSGTYFTEKFAREGIADARYELLPLENIGGLRDLLRQRPELRGLNVTIPHKESVLPLLDALDETAFAVGAVNCIKITDGRLKGFNTDVIGFETSFLNSALPAPPDGEEDDQSLALIRKNTGLAPFSPPPGGPGGASALILGTGGASKAVAFVLKKLNIPFLFVSRAPAAANEITYGDLKNDPYILENASFIINTTPLGMSPYPDTCPDLPFERLSSEHLVYDLVYNPAETLLLQRAKARGCATRNGLEMLYLQAEAAWKIWQQP